LFEPRGDYAVVNPTLPAEPDAQTQADVYFNAGVEAFEKGQYNQSGLYFNMAMVLVPDDIVIPYAYSQALFASEQYREASRVLRSVLKKVTPDKEGIFFFRGLYPDDKTLNDQIQKLINLSNLHRTDMDLKLLLGYQLFGIGELAEANNALSLPSHDPNNGFAAGKLLDSISKVRSAQ